MNQNTNHYLSWIDVDNEFRYELLDKNVPQFVVGRSDQVHVEVLNTSVSRKHARLFWKNNHLWIEDLKSSYGTSIDGQSLKPNCAVRLNVDTEIKLGNLSLWYEMRRGHESQELFQTCFHPRNVTDEFELTNEFNEFRVNLLSLLQDNFGDNTLNVQLIKNIDDELHQLINAQEFRLKEQRILNSISNILNRSLTLSELLKTSLNLISKVLNADRGFVIIHHEHEGSFEVPALRNFTEFSWDSISTEPQNFSRFLVKKCFENNQILFIGDTKLNNEITDLQQPGAGGGRSVALIPLTQEQHVVGVIYLDHETKPHHFNQLQTPFLTTFAAHTSIALHNTLLYKRAITDDLTQLYTRQHIDEVLDLEIQRARQENSQMSLLLMDLDHFKQINDTYGHTVGDQVLQTFSRIIQERIRGCDLAGRFGGEEFIIILPDTHQAGAIKFAERIRSAVAEQQFHKNGDVFQVTVSVGTITHQPHHGDNALLLLEQADQALYQAKEQGRNRTVSFAD